MGSSIFIKLEYSNEKKWREAPGLWSSPKKLQSDFSDNLLYFLNSAAQQGPLMHSLAKIKCDKRFIRHVSYVKFNSDKFNLLLNLSIGRH
jgi:hypothetical protein